MRRLILMIVSASVALSSAAQVEKSVEVTKEFVPEIADSERIAVVPEVRDTVRMRPEIDYSISPKAVETSFSTRRFQPSTLTYWTMDHVYPFYLKLGAGYPVNTVADFYASTIRRDVGYAMGYLNHVGRFTDIRMEDPVSLQTYSNNSNKMMFRVGAAAGKFYGRNILEGDVNYESDVFYRYPYPEFATPQLTAREVNYESIGGKFRFGSRNMTSSRLGFSVDADIDYLNDKSETLASDAKYRQLSARVGGVIDFRAGEHGRMNVGVDWNGYYGLKALDAYSDCIVSPSVSYSYSSTFPLSFRAGARAFVDRMDGHSTFSIVPDVRLDWNVGGNGAFAPYASFDGAVRNNSYRKLLDANQYLAIPSTSLSVGQETLDRVDALPNTLSYGFHFGIAGHTRSSVLAYDVSFNVDYADHDLFWYNIDRLYFAATTAHRTTYSVVGSLEYHPVSELLLSMEAEGLFYGTDAPVENALPSFRMAFDCTYSAQKFSVSLGADYVGKSSWTVVEGNDSGVENQPGAFLLELRADYRVRRYISLFLEGHNLANQDIYRFLNYKEYGIGFTVGVRWMF